jgi:PQQ-dependent catabolism-associated CXXCW motif protein
MPLPRFAFALAAAFLALAAPAAAQETVPEPGTYRDSDYRSPVPATLKGATVIHTQEAEALWTAKAAVFVDVLPRPPKPKNLPAGTIWRDKKRQNIPGSMWLPNVGYGGLPPAMDAYFREALARATGGDTGKALVFYCLTDCWMSWNAAKRAMEYGYGKVLWYPEGTDGWEQELLPVEKSTPEPLPDLPDAPVEWHAPVE